ncbi:MAG TPA: c-type cytochrome biogenesis protein CcmI [Rhodocyclaceae bacterium]|nr:c-type cytochrome biogenesis protein CcmI [Rhodocyclaceae bacterium]
MTLFLIAAAILVMAATATLLWPLLRRTVAEDAVESPALKILREQRVDLEAERDAGKINEASYVQSLAEIERRALEESLAPERAVTNKPRLAWAIAVGVAMPVTAVAVYLLIGNPAGLDPANAIAQQEHSVTPEQIDAMVTKLAERLKANPDDIQGLEMLGRSYMVLSRFSDAAAVFEQLAKKQPEDAQVFADWADAVAGTQNRQLAGAPEKLIARALELDPHNVKALALSGTLAFDRQNYKQAITQWEQIAALVPAEGEFGQSVRSMIDEARHLAGLPAQQVQIAQAQTQAPAAATPPAAALQIKGRVTISAALKSQVGANDTLFVFARTGAGGPPVAGMRFKASELPLDFDMSKAQMMMGTVGPQDKVIIGARVSKSGTPGAQSGDLQGFSQPVLASDSKLLQIEISEQVK